MRGLSDLASDINTVIYGEYKPTDGTDAYGKYTNLERTNSDMEMPQNVGKTTANINLAEISLTADASSLAYSQHQKPMKLPSRQTALPVPRPYYDEVDRVSPVRNMSLKKRKKLLAKKQAKK